MLEREKQRTDQQKKHAAEKERQARPKEDNKKNTKQKQAGSDTNPATMQDKDYVKRIEEKTEKH
jgi:hypothetical protein